jgi:hypothetical protein
LKIYWTILFLTIAISALGQRDITGYYSSNTADMGFFVTKIQLNKDSTFKYEFSGDMMYNKGTGTYRIENKKIIHLAFDKDSLTTIEKALSINGKRPQKLVYKGGRLHEFTVDGQIVKKGKGLSRHKKFLFFGDRYLATRRLYLKKRNGDLIWRIEKNENNQRTN